MLKSSNVKTIYLTEQLQYNLSLSYVIFNVIIISLLFLLDLISIETDNFCKKSAFLPDNETILIGSNYF